MWIQIDEKHLDKLKLHEAVSYLFSRVKQYKEIDSSPLTQQYREAARSSDGEIEVDEDAVVSMGDDPGAYVMCWQWVSNEAAGIETEEGDE
jgi:hypothetical protein